MLQLTRTVCVARRELRTSIGGSRTCARRRLHRCPGVSPCLGGGDGPANLVAHMAGLRRTVLLALATGSLSACTPAAVSGHPIVPGADSERGRALIEKTGCGACHEIPGVTGASGQVGPSLAQVGRRAVIAGVLPNTPVHMVRWIETPQSIVPGNAMPNMEINDHDARDVAAYLYTLR